VPDDDLHGRKLVDGGSGVWNRSAAAKMQGSI
jgi:hypothetical protein